MLNWLNVPGNAGREVECSEGRGCQRDHGVVKLSFEVLRSAGRRQPCSV